MEITGLNHPRAVAFDSTGLLYIANAFASNVLVYDVSTPTSPSLVRTLTGVSGCTNTGSGNQILCALGNLSAGAVQTIRVTATVNSDVYPGSSLENGVDVTTASIDNNLLNNRATADTTVLGLSLIHI